MKNHENIYINGAWVPSGGDGSIDVMNPSTEEIVGSIPDGVASDVNAAVEAARAAFPSWSALSLEERLSYIEGLAGQLGERMEEVGELISAEMGMPQPLANMIQAGLPAGTTSRLSLIHI